MAHMPTAPTIRAAGLLGRGRHLLGASALLLAGAATADAQAAGPDPRWRAWLGCWSPVNAEGAVPAGAPLTCVVPASGTGGVELVVVSEGRVAARERLDVTGERRPRQADGCDGWEQAQWSADGRRLHLRDSATCSGGVTRASSGILAFAPDGDWLEVRSASVGTGAGVRVTRHRHVSPSAAVPAEVASALAASRRDEEVRLALGGPISTDEVADAVRLSDAPVVEAWLAARGQGFTLDARRLTQLADRGVPPRVIDVMVALSYPKVFALNPATGDQERRAVASAPQEPGAGRGIGPTAWIYPSPFGFGALGWDAYRYGAYGYNGYYGNGFYGGGWFPGGRPVVIVVRGSEGEGTTERARAVNGRGYTRGRSSGTSSPGATPRASAGSGSSASSGGSSGSSSSGGSTSKSGSGRTAKPRP